MKPLNMPIKDYLIPSVSDEVEIDSKICDTVISWVYNEARLAAINHREVEISGFGKFYISRVKVEKRLKKIEAMIKYFKEKAESQEDKEKYEAIVKKYENDLEFVKTKRYET